MTAARLFALALTLTAFSAGCGDEAPPPPPQTAAPKPAAKPKAIAEETPTSTTVFSYSPIGKRDPFQSYLVELRAEGNKEAQRRREPTEEFELDQYKLS